MRREHGTLFTARPCDSREGAAGDHVHAGRFTGIVFHGNAGCAGDDGREFDDAYQSSAAGRLCPGGKILPKPEAFNDLLADGLRTKSVCRIHQSPGKDRPPK